MFTAIIAMLALVIKLWIAKNVAIAIAIYLVIVAVWLAMGTALLIWIVFIRHCLICGV